jgi:hypothetical protein
MIRVIAVQKAEEIAKLINNETFSMTITSRYNEEVKYKIVQRLGAIVEVQLYFKNPEGISSTSVKL